jgi:SnoaL-like protein
MMISGHSQLAFVPPSASVWLNGRAGAGMVVWAMPDPAAVRETAEQYVDRLERRDWPAVGELLADGVVYEMPQSRERIRGRAAFLQFNQEYPGDWHLRVRRALADDRHAALWLDVRVGDEPLDACIWLDLSDDGRIERITDYWPEPFEPLAGREHLTERY